ncbi:MAG: glycosyltransferase [Anaerolineae bacterium]|nr:glycosyltransferase [Anaerolineae bacterium]
MRILSITNQISVPMHGGAPVYTYNLLKRIAAKHEVWHVAFSKTPEQIAGAEQLRTFCREVITLPIGEFDALDQPFDLARYLAFGKPPELRFIYSRQLADHIKRLAQSIDFDIVQIEHGDMGQYLDLFSPEMRARSIWMLHDVDWLKYARIAQMEPKRARKWRLLLHSRMMRYWKPRQAARFGRCTTVSERDRTLMVEANPNLNVGVVPAGVDTHKLQPLPPYDSLACVFVGNMNYLPNSDAAVYFCREILPFIHQTLPEVEVWIVGTSPRPEVEALADDKVHVTGAVEEVESYYERSTVCIMPLRAGGGARLKILEAMALGRPVVTTSIGCEGQDVLDGTHVLIGDTPGTFAEHVIRLLTDASLRRRLAIQARALVIEQYDWDISARRLSEIYAGLIGANDDRR